MENTDFVIEHIDEEVQVIADQPSVVTNYPANTDFFIENIDSNVISIAHSLNIEASEVDFRPANTDFFIENIDKNVIAIAESMNLSPSEVDFRPANTDFFVENIDKNLIEIAESLSLTPYEVTIRPANTDMFIENIDKNVTLIKGSTNVVTVSGEYININLPDGGKVQSAQIDGNATQTGTPTPDSPQPISVVTGENVVKVLGKNLWNQDDIVVGYLNATGGTTTGSGNDRTTGSFVAVQPNTMYTLSASTTGPYGYLKIAEYDINQGFALLNTATASSKTYTITTGATTRYLKASAYFGSETPNIQLELGSTATTYEPYTAQDYPINLGKNLIPYPALSDSTTILAKIGTYQDRIYKDGEKWYVEKQVGKVTWDGSEANWYYYVLGASGYIQYYRDLSGVAHSTDEIRTMSDHFTSGVLDDRYRTPNLVYSTNAGIAFNPTTADFADLNAFKSWLASHPTTVYYALATPTTTEITDQTLIDQLEALASATLNQGINNIFTEIATGNAMPTLKLVIEKY